MQGPAPSRHQVPVEPDPLGSLERAFQAIRTDNDALRAFLTVVDRPEAFAAARDAAARRRNGTARGPLDGLAVAVKDNIDTAALLTTRGSTLYADRVPGRDAEVVRRIRAGGAIVIGKTNLTELACGTTGGNERFGGVVNPTWPDRCPGGSSSGSAAAVAAGLVPLAIGTDTSCSIRYPAAACGIVGLKPTFGRVSTAGVAVCSRPVDHVGPMSREVTETAAALAVMQNHGWDDPRATLRAPTAGLRIGVLGAGFVDGLDHRTAATFEAALERLAALGCSLAPADPLVDPDEVSGHLDVLCRDMLAAYGPDIAAAPDRIGPELRGWVERYRRQTDRQYREAVRFHRALWDAGERFMADFDVVVCPTMRSGPRLIGHDHTDDRGDRVGNCSVWSMSGQPSLTVPYPPGRSDANDAPEPTEPSVIPFGLLITGRRGDDGTVLRIGRAFTDAR